MDAYMIISRGKIKGMIAALTAAALSACVLLPVGAAHAAAETAASEPVLFLPSSYEQYLELEAPVRAAFSEHYIAIVDGQTGVGAKQTLYIFDRGAQSYSAVALQNITTQIGFSGDRLFLSDRSEGTFGFYEYQFDRGALEQVAGINGSTFCIDGDALYVATVGGDGTTIAKLSVSDLGGKRENLGTVDERGTPNMTVQGGTLYCAFGAALYRAEGGAIAADSWLSAGTSVVTNNVRSFCAHGGAFYYTAPGGLYRKGNDVPLLAAEELGSLVSYGGSLYAVCGNAVREIALEEDGAHFTDYEITAASASKNRLNGAADTARSGDLVVTADTGNRRVSVYDAGDGSYEEIAVASAPSLVSTDGDLIAAAAESRIFYGKDLTASAQTDEPVLGLACVYGCVYYVTERAYGCIAPDGAQTEVFHGGHGAPATLAADAYGDLFVAMSDRKVYRFAEREFLDGDAQGELLLTLPEGYSSLRSDSEGNLLYLVGDSVFRGEERDPLITLGGDYVYTSSDPHPLAFALGYEDAEVTFLFGNFAVSAELPVATLSTIGAEDAFDTISRPQAADGISKIAIGKGEIGIRIDLARLDAASEYFGYAGRNRIGADTDGIVLAETENCLVVSVYEDNVFHVYLFRAEGRARETLTTRAASGSFFVTNEVYLYHYPALLLDHYPCDGTDGHDAESVPTHPSEPLARGTRVTVLALVDAPERTYAYVSCGEQTGYLPLSYLTEVDPAEQNSDTYLEGKLKKATVFTSADGETVTLGEGTQVRLVEDEDGYRALHTAEDGTVYEAHVGAGDIDWGENDALRIALIVILSVLALLIIGVYIYLLPRKPKSL